jgi:hypothetical protein
VDDLIRVAVVENEPAAELAVSMLAMEGVRAMWRKTDIGAAVWGVGPTDGVGGPIEILVQASDAPRAHDLLSD